jgi:hypothetical protein
MPRAVSSRPSRHGSRRNRETTRRLAPTEHAERIREYLEHKPKRKFGTHGYAPEAWSFDALEFHGRLGPYIEHYGVALE